MPPSTSADFGAVARFLSDRETAADRRICVEHQSIWQAARRERWCPLTIAAAFVAVRARHDAAQPAQQ